MSFPPEPAKHLDWAKLDIVVRDIVAGHIESRYSEEAGQWSKPVFVKDPYLRLHGLSPALNYGQQAYEGLKAHRSHKNEILLFRTNKHAKRMAHSTSMVSIPVIPPSHFEYCVSLAVTLNAEFVPPASSGSALYIRPVAFGSNAHLSLTAATEYIFCVYVQPFGTYHGTSAIDCLILEDFDRAAERGTGSAKVGGNYAPAIKWMDKARKEGFPITLHLDSKTRTEIEEFSTAGFAGIKDDGNGNITLVVPDSKNIIESVTSDSCVELARSFGWKLEIRPIKVTELANFSEVFAASTAAAIVPIQSITYRSAGEKYFYGKSDSSISSPPCYQKLYDALKGIQNGEVTDSFGWNTVIIEPPSEYTSDGGEDITIGGWPRNEDKWRFSIDGI